VTTRRRDRSRSRGLSTAEVLAGSALTLIALAGMYSFQLSQSRALAAQNVYTDSQNVTRTVIDLLSRELRMAAFDPAGTALPTAPGPSCPGVKQGLVEGTASRLRFRQDLDANGAIAGPSEDVTYELSGSDLVRTDGGVPTTLVSGIPSNGFALRYFDGSNPPVELVPVGVPAALTPSQRDCVAKVRITVRAELPNPDPGNPVPIASEAQTEIAIRNRSLENF